MKGRLINDEDGRRTFVLAFDTNDDVVPALRAWATARGVSSASFIGIGAFREVVLGYFDIDQAEYTCIRLREQVEVLTLAGNIALMNGEPKVHAHVVVGKRDGTAHGGHLLAATVRPTLEVVVVDHPPHLRRRTDAATGLALLDVEA